MTLLLLETFCRIHAKFGFARDRKRPQITAAILRFGYLLAQYKQKPVILRAVTGEVSMYTTRHFFESRDLQKRAKWNKRVRALRFSHIRFPTEKRMRPAYHYIHYFPLEAQACATTASCYSSQGQESLTTCRCHYKSSILSLVNFQLPFLFPWA